MKVACSNWTRVAHVQLQQIKNSCHLMDCAQYVSCDSSLGYSVILLSSGNLRIWLLNTVCIDILFVINLIYLQKGHMKVACSNWTRVAHVQLQKIKNSCNLMDCDQYVSCDSLTTTSASHKLPFWKVLELMYPRVLLITSYIALDLNSNS